MFYTDDRKPLSLFAMECDMPAINKDDIASVDELSLTVEEKANLKLLNIRDGILVSVVDKKKLVGSLVLPDSVTEIGEEVEENLQCKLMLKVLLTFLLPF